MAHSTATAERVVTGTLANVYSGELEQEQAVRNLRAHAEYCRAQKDERTAVVADGVASELEAGALPTLNLAGETIEPPEELPELAEHHRPVKPKKPKN